MNTKDRKLRKSSNGYKNIDKVSFALGGMICSLLSIAITVYFLNSLTVMYTLAKITMIIFLLFVITIVAYQIKRGEIWNVLLGSNLFQARDNLSESIKALVPGHNKENEVTISPTQAIQNLSAIYGDFQVRKLMIFSIIGAFGAFSAMITAAFLIRQTSILSDQIEISKEIAKSESLYKPYWQLMHTESEQEMQELFTDILYQGDTSTLSRLKLRNFNFKPLSGHLSKAGFKCYECSFSNIRFEGVDLSGEVYFEGGNYHQFMFQEGEIEDINFTNTKINNGGENQVGRSLFYETNVKRLIMRATVWNGGGVYGIEERKVTNFDIRHLASSEWHNLVFSRVNVTSKEPIGQTFYSTSFHNVKFSVGSMTNLYLAEIDIYGSLILDQIDFDSVTFSHNQLRCIEGIDLDTPGITWIQSTGRCVDKND